MPQHSARKAHSRWRWLAAVAALVLVGPPAVVLTTAYGDRQAPDGAGAACPTLRVVTARSFAPVLDAAARTAAAGTACSRLGVTVADGRGAPARAAELDADLWVPDDTSWRGAPDRLALAEAPSAGAGAVLATSPLYLATDPATAARIAKQAAAGVGLPGSSPRPDRTSGSSPTIPAAAATGCSPSAHSARRCGWPTAWTPRRTRCPSRFPAPAS